MVSNVDEFIVQRACQNALWLGVAILPQDVDPPQSIVLWLERGKDHPVELLKYLEMILNS